MATLDVLVAARADVERGWRKYVADDCSGHVCAVGAVLRHARYLPQPAFAVLAAALPYHSPYGDDRAIAQYNDWSGITKADVLALFDRAIVAEAVKATSDPAHTYVVPA